MIKLLGALVTGVLLGRARAGADSGPNYSVTFLTPSSATYPVGTFFQGADGVNYAAITTDPTGPFRSLPCIFKGYAQGGSTEKLGSTYLIYRMRLDFDQEVVLHSFSEVGVGSQDGFWRALDPNMNLVASNSLPFVINRLVTNQVNVALRGSSFIFDEWDKTSTSWRYRQKFDVAATPVTNRAFVGYPAAVQADQPIAWWRLDDGAGSPNRATQGLTAIDIIGERNGLYTTNVQVGVPGYSAADLDTAAAFGTLASKSYVGPISGIDFSTQGPNAEFSVEAWVRASPQTTDNGIVTVGYGSGGEQFDLDANNGWRFLVRQPSGTVSFIAASAKPDGRWHHLAGVCDQAKGFVGLYIDSVLSGKASITPGAGLLAPTTPLFIGARYGFSTSTFPDLQFVGSIDEVALYDYPLSAAQVRNHFDPALSSDLPGASFASAAVPATANIFGAGHSVAPGPAGGGAGVLPSVVNLSSGTRFVQFPKITGLIGTVSGSPSTPPDGIQAGYNGSSYGGISGIVADYGGFLAGVFLDNAEPTNPAPPRLTFQGAAESYQVLRPLLQQTFYIGDGLTGSGTGDPQTLFVPAGATRLCLGIFDAPGWSGPPGDYADNSGQFNVTVAMFPPPSIRLSISGLSSGGLSLGMTMDGAFAGIVAELQSSTNLVDWTPVQTNIASQVTVSVTNVVNSASPPEYFRAVVR